MIRTHLKGTFAPTRWAATYWRSRTKAGEPNDARIINTTSVSGLYGNPGQTNYGAAKAGIAMFTQIAAAELDRYGVTVNAVAPGPTNTALMAPAFDNPGMIDAFSQRVPQGSLTSTDVTVGPVLFLASPMASSITGHTLYADGGMSAT